MRADYQRNMIRMSVHRRLYSVTALAAVLVLAGCGDWFTTFTQQPSISNWEVATMDSSRIDSTGARGNPVGSVPMIGGDYPDWVFPYTPIDGVINQMSVLENPVPATMESINRGHRYFQINCAVCHGDLGMGDGKAVSKDVGFLIPKSLVSDTVRNRSDGFIYGVIRNGRGQMPSYNRIEALNRWDVVNYLRGLQGMLSFAVPTGPLAIPGETGDAVPGATATSPQQSVPFYPPSRIGGGE